MRQQCAGHDRKCLQAFFAAGVLLFAVVSTNAEAQVSWKHIGTVTTLTANQLCYTDGTNVICDATAPTDSAGLLGLGSTAPIVSLDMSKKSDALALPVGTTGTRPTGANLTNGEIRYNSSTPGVEAYVNGSWATLTAGGATGTGTTNYEARWLTSTTLGTGTLYDNGNQVGIGTTSPPQELTVFRIDPSTYVSSSTTSYSPFTSSNAADIEVANASATDVTAAYHQFNVSNTAGNTQRAYISAVSTTGAAVYSPSLTFGMQSGSSAYSEYMRINSNGNVGIGATAPVALLQVGAGNNNFANFNFNNTSIPNAWFGLTIGANESGGAGEANFWNGYVTALRSFDFRQVTTSGSAANTLMSIYANGGVSLGTGYAGITAPVNGEIIQGNVGIGTTSPIAALDVNSPSFPVLHSVRTFAGAGSSAVTAGEMSAQAAGAVTDGFGPALVFSIAGNGFSETQIANISAVRNGANNSGALTFSTYSLGSLAEQMRITSTGSVGIGTTTLSQLLTVNGNIDAMGSNGYITEIANAGTTGTTLNTLAKINSSGAVIATTADTDGIVGIVVGGASTTGNAQIAVEGQAYCTFDTAPTTPGDYVTISSTTGGDCHDAGTTRSTTSENIGRVLSTTAVSGTYLVDLSLAPSLGGLGGATTPISSLAAATKANSFDNAAYAQTWTWNTLTTGTALTMSSSSETSGSLLGLTSTNTGTTGNILNVTSASTGAAKAIYGSVTGASNTGYAIQAVNNSSTGWGVYSSGTSPNYFNGNVGIGTTAPQAPLHLFADSGTTPDLLIGGGGFTNNYLSISGGRGMVGLATGEYQGNGALILNAGSSKSIEFLVNGTTGSFVTGLRAMSIINSGLVGIGTTSPVNLLDISGAMAIGTSYAGVSTAPANGAIIQGNVGIGTSAVPTGVTASVNGPVQVAGTGSEACSSSTVGAMRYNSAGGYMQICTYP